jgi:hypothetical protein
MEKSVVCLFKERRLFVVFTEKKTRYAARAGPRATAPSTTSLENRGAPFVTVHTTWRAYEEPMMPRLAQPKDARWPSPELIKEATRMPSVTV